MNWARLYLGILIVAVGALLLLDAAEVLDAGAVIADWWPVAVIGAGILGFASNPRHWAAALILVFVGAALLLRTTDVVDTLSVVIPAVIILIGVFIILGRGLTGRSGEVGDRLNAFNVFSGSELGSHSKQFQGGSVGALFGGSEIDLRDAYPAPGASLDVFAAFGGVEVQVPQGWQVTVHGFPLFGGFDNVTAKERVPENAPLLDINATVLFGGLEVKH